MSGGCSTSIPTSIVVGLEQGVLALLGSKSSKALLQLTSSHDLIVLCCALFSILSTFRDWKTILVGRISVIMANVFYTIALNTLFDAVVVPGETGLTLVNLLSIFFLGSALDPQNTMTVTSQYLLVSTLARALEGFKQEGVALAWALASIPPAFVMLVGGDGQVIGLAQLVAVDSVAGWVRSGLPKESMLPGTLAALYLVAPFVKQFPSLGRLYRFAVFAVANDTGLHSLPNWLLAVGLWILWVFEPDPVSKSLAATAGANMWVLVLLDAMQFAMDNDPALILTSLLLVVRVLEHA
jgi:hypothetical protein